MVSEGILLLAGQWLKRHRSEWEGTSLVIIIWTSILLPLSIVATIWTRSLLRKGTGPFKMWFTILSTMPLLTVPTAILFGIDLLASGKIHLRSVLALFSLKPLSVGI